MKQFVLNDHLTKALRFLKKAKPEDNVDRYVLSYNIGNHKANISIDKSFTNHFSPLPCSRPL